MKACWIICDLCRKLPVFSVVFSWRWKTCPYLSSCHLRLKSATSRSLRIVSNWKKNMIVEYNCLSFDPHLPNIHYHSNVWRHFLISFSWFFFIFTSFYIVDTNLRHWIYEERYIWNYLAKKLIHNSINMSYSLDSWKQQAFALLTVQQTLGLLSISFMM